MNTKTGELSVAHMRSPGGWVEPGQTPEFREITEAFTRTGSSLHVQLGRASYTRGFGFTGSGAHHARNACSASPESVLGMPQNTHLMRALVRREGFHVGNGSAEAFGSADTCSS